MSLRPGRSVRRFRLPTLGRPCRRVIKQWPALAATTGDVMSLGQRLNTLEAILQRLFEKIEQEHLTLMGAGTTKMKGDPGYEAFQEKLEGFGEELARLTRELSTVKATIDWRAQLAKSYPRELRYRANQSVKELRNREQQVYQLAFLVEKRLRELHFAGNTPTIGDIVRLLNKLSRELEKFAAHLKTEIQKNGCHFETLTSSMPVVPNVPLSFIVALIALYIASWRKRESQTA